MLWLPVKYNKYTGSIGSRQGEINVIIPSKNNNKYCIDSLRTYLFPVYLN